MVSRYVPTVRILAVIVALGVTAAACSGSQDTASQDTAPKDTASPDQATSSTSTTIENYPDAQTRALAARARERRPVDNSALPPRHLDPARHPETLIDRFAIVSGGPPPDGIPSIDEPTFGAADGVDWLDEDEPVAVLTVGDTTRIYPTQILIWHEIVNDEIDGRPITMTYCPLCNSVVAFEATTVGLDGTELRLDFGTSGALYQSALVMYDRQTESLWTHFDGQAVVGTLRGKELSILPAAMVSWADARQAHPNAAVLDRPTGPQARPYGRAPYANYETSGPSTFYLNGEVDDRLDSQQRVVGINLDGQRLAIDRRALANDRLVETAIGDTRLVVFWEPGTTSALDGKNIADGLDVGSVGVFLAESEGQPLTFTTSQNPENTGPVITDVETGTRWNLRGQAVAGPLAGRSLTPVAHLDTFWFAWSRYHPDTDLVS